MCISKSLTETEKQYSQIEKEALAVVWATERLNIYLLGNTFVLEVDNKALELILKNPLSKPPARIQRWQLRLSAFTYTVKHIPGKGNIADFLSRHPVSETSSRNTDIEDYISALVEYSIPRSLRREDIINATNTDSTCQMLIECVKKGKLKKEIQLEEYKNIFNE